MNNIIKNKSMIQSKDNHDNHILNCNIMKCICNNNKCNCIEIEIDNKNVPDSTPFTPNVPPNNDIIMNDFTNKIKKVHFNDTITIINDGNDTNRSDNYVSNDFNDFHRDII
eukprot:513454_1